MQLSSPDSNLTMPEILKGSRLIPNSFYTKNGINGRTLYATTSHHEKIVVVLPYHMSS